ncbi:hypothetical protein N7539_009350 [Penicillium diatomitis]|uniref:NACHT domain-containing protein n=1 Tax=Penicillium diatomitis TaxID=2819901 RepID=A0A9X0BJZ7_9EURO|nr:uncharacterized protein N7539_009350 [Penicillium diatomitis]KAJ5469732.1 hypothetical protein N7539_009350 [Penicillium diatomitis]
MAQSNPKYDGLRDKLRRRLNHFRDRSRGPLNKETQAQALATTNLLSLTQNQTRDDTFKAIENCEVHEESVGVQNAVRIQPDQVVLQATSLEANLTAPQRIPGGESGSVDISSGLWSAAFREAVEGLREDIDIATLKGKDAAQLLKDLEDVAKEATQTSMFWKGLKYLQTLQVPLQRFKDVLDLASPLANLEPTAATVVGVVRGLTAIAISFANSDSDFADKLESMLTHISYIDECDTLGRKAEEKKIHRALVLVYRKILEFYQAVCEMLARKGMRFVIKMVLESDRLPNIVQDIMKCSDILHNLVQTTTLKILQDIEDRLIHEQVRSWLGAEKMKGQTCYHDELKFLRADQACDFILRDSNFRAWYHGSGSRLLVILGEMGRGKTVLMAYIVDQLYQRKGDQLPNPKICYYYCREDETGNVVAVLSALILSLLQQLPGLKRHFCDWYNEKQALGCYDPAASIESLEEYLQNMLEAIDRPIFFLVDGIDECDKNSTRRLLKLLKHLSANISGLRILISSRPQERILSQLDKIPSVAVSSGAQRDMVIAEKIADMYLPHLAAELRALVIKELSPLAQGSAIWTKMAVQLLELRDVNNEDQIRRFVKEAALPQDLSKLYASLLSRCTGNDSENNQLAFTALKILSAIHRPLSIMELAWAVTLSVTDNVTTVHALGKQVDHRRIVGLIYPFISRVDFNDLKKHQVRLVHQSVKDFVQGNSISKHLRPQYTMAGETGHVSVIQYPERPAAFILSICIRYLLLDEIGSKDLFSEEQAAIAELPQECDIFSDNEKPVKYDPHCTWEMWEENMIRFEPSERGFGEFFVYASCYWLKHFGAVEDEPLPSLSDVERLCQVGSIRLRNWIQQNCRPGCTVAPRFEFDYRLYDPLCITSLYGSVPMLRDLLKSSSFAKDTYFPKPAMEAVYQILRWGDISRLLILFLDDQVGQQLQNLHFFRSIIKVWQNPRQQAQEVAVGWNSDKVTNWDDLFALLDVVLGRMVQERWGNELLCVAASAGCMPVIQGLMDSARQNEELRNELLRRSRVEPQWTIFEPVHQSLGEAVLRNRVDVVGYLVKVDGIDTHLRYQNSRGENVLHLASMICNPEIFQILAPRFPEGINQKDCRGDTPLLRVIMNFSASGNRFESARILLSQSTHWQFAEKHYRKLFRNLFNDF